MRRMLKAALLLTVLGAAAIASACACVAPASSAAAIAAVSPGETMMPVSPTIRRESPTSVATTGAPQAIASAMTFGNPSPKIEVESNRSAAA